MVDVVERVVAAAVGVGEQVRRHPADDHLALARVRRAASATSSSVSELRLTPCGITCQGLSTPSSSYRFAARSAVTTYAFRFGRESSATCCVVVHGIVDVGDDGAVEVADLLVVEREHRAVAPVGEREDGWVAHAATPAESAVLEPAWHRRSEATARYASSRERRGSSSA